MLHRKADDENLFGTTKRKAPNFKEYQAYLIKTKKEESEYNKRKLTAIKPQENKEISHHIEHNQKLVTEVNLYKDAPSATSIYSIIGKRKLELFKMLNSKVTEEGGSHQAFEKPKIANFVQINKKLPKVNLKTTSATDNSILCPIAFLPEKLFDTYSEANRYEKVLQVLLLLKYNISKNQKDNVKIIKDFLFKNGFSLDDITSQNIINFDDFLSQSSLPINPKLNLKSNIFEIMNTNFVREVQQIHDFGKEEKCPHIAQNTSSSDELHPENFGLVKKGVATITQKDKDLTYKVKSEPKYNNMSVTSNNFTPGSNDKSNNDSQLSKNKIEKQRNDDLKYQTVYKVKKHDKRRYEPQNRKEGNFAVASVKKLDTSQSPQELQDIIEEINTDLEKNNLKLDNMNYTEIDEDYFSTQRLYQKSIKSIPTKINEAKILSNLNRDEFCKKKKLLEYVILKYYKDNNYYKEEAIKLEDEVKQRVKQIVVKKRHTTKALRMKIL